MIHESIHTTTLFDLHGVSDQEFQNRTFTAKKMSIKAARVRPSFFSIFQLQHYHILQSTAYYLTETFPNSNPLQNSTMSGHRGYTELERSNLLYYLSNHPSYRPRDIGDDKFSIEAYEQVAAVMNVRCTSRLRDYKGVSLRQHATSSAQRGYYFDPRKIPAQKLHPSTYSQYASASSSNSQAQPAQSSSSGQQYGQSQPQSSNELSWTDPLTSTDYSSPNDQYSGAQSTSQASSSQGAYDSYAAQAPTQSYSSQGAYNSYATQAPAQSYSSQGGYDAQYQYPNTGYEYRQDAPLAQSSAQNSGPSQDYGYSTQSSAQYYTEQQPEETLSPASGPTRNHRSSRSNRYDPVTNPDGPSRSSGGGGRSSKR